MKIAIDISPLSGGHSGRGVGVYTRLILEALQKYETEHSYSLITQKQPIPDDTDVVHYPFFDPFFLTLPLVRNKPTVVTVHDIIPLKFPEKFPRGIRGELKWQIQKRALLSSSRIITDSMTSKKDITQLTGYPIDKIDTVYLGPSLHPLSRAIRSDFTKFMGEHQVGTRYILFVGDVNWNKNIEGLLQSFAKVIVKNPDVLLLLVGKSFLNDALPETIKIKQVIRSLQIVDNIRMPGFVPESALSSIYTSASCFVAPSFYEGFGLPVIDAMSLGCPVVVSDVSSLKEIAGPSLRVNPKDSDSIASGIQKAISMSSADRKKLIQSGLDWAKQFTWKKAAAETVASYTKVTL